MDDEEALINDEDVDDSDDMEDEFQDADVSDESDEMEVLHVDMPDELAIEEQEEARDTPANDDYIDLVNYDICLPLEHSYLGGLSTLQSGRTIFSEGAKLKLPLVYLNGIILVPGHEIPFTFRHQSLVDFFRRVIAHESKTFGVGYDTNYGTTAEIRSYSFKGNEVSIRAEGRQRFVIKSKLLEMYEIYNAHVVILPEIDLGGFFQPMKAMCNSAAWKTKELASLTPFPYFVFRQFDDYLLMSKLRAILESIIEPSNRSDSFTFPENPTAFSYFVLTCIPFSDRMKGTLLQFNCTTERLRIEYALLSIPFEVQCAHCAAPLCSKKDFLVMSKSGTGGTFVNPGGIVHELFTFSKVSNVSNVSDWSDEFSWFPNYGWIIIRCRRCMIHLGWKFVTKKNINPKSFWAITRTSIKLAFTEIEQDSFVYKFVHENNQINIHYNVDWD